MESPTPPAPNGISPFYMGLAMDMTTKTIKVLGFRQTSSEIQSLASERAMALPWTCIAMHHDHQTVGNAIHDWLVLRGLHPEQAELMVRSFAWNALRAMKKVE